MTVPALVHDPAAPRGLRFADVPEPEPTDSQVLVEVHAVSLNFGELAYLGRRPAGSVPGNDAAGIVVRAARDGTGPGVGTRVTTFGWDGGWARLRAVDPDNLAVVPDGVDLGSAAALPAAGVTALQAVRGLGSVLGRRVLVTGAAGGVGRFAVQLAARAGAEVVAAVGGAGRGAGLPSLGAREVVTGLAGLAPVHGVLDNVGGPLLTEAFALLEPGGRAQSIGKASGRPTTIDFEEERLRGGDRHLAPFVVAAPFGPDLTYLVGLLATGGLDPQIGWRGSWERATEAADELLSRRLRGKAVLTVSGPS